MKNSLFRFRPVIIISPFSLNPLLPIMKTVTIVMKIVLKIKRVYKVVHTGIKTCTSQLIGVHDPYSQD